MSINIYRHQTNNLIIIGIVIINRIWFISIFNLFLMASWVDKRIAAINRKIRRSGNKRAMTEGYICEMDRLYKTTCKNKKEYKKWISQNGNQ